MDIDLEEKLATTLDLIDLTHQLSTEIPHWGETCGFQYKNDIDYAECTTDVKFREQSLQMVAGIGTHIDAPSHCFAKQADISQLSLQSLITKCCMIDVSDRAHERYQISPEDIQQFEKKFGTIPKGAIVIFYTGWSKRWHQPEKYRNGHVFPSLAKDTAELLLTRNIAGIGIDVLSPDTGDSDFAVHRILLGAGKFIIENVANANKLSPKDHYLLALPIKIKGGTEAPIRLVAIKK